MLTNRLFFLLIAVAMLSFAACGPARMQAPTPTLIAPTATLIPSTPTLTNTLTITSTLENQTTLPHRIQWVAMSSVSEDQVSEVDFLIDGQLAFVENHEPYTYGRDGNYLVTSFLTPGEHDFTVRVLTVGGQTAESTVKAAVESAPNPPDGLANTSWTREMTDSDRQKATSSGPPPSGIWGLNIDSVGWKISYVSEDPERKDPQGFDVEYQSGGQVELRPTIARPVFPNNFGGSICEEPDIPFLWTYTMSDDGKTLTLHPVGQDPCGDRAAILEGTWTRDDK
jgi:hypothetical protein